MCVYEPTSPTTTATTTSTLTMTITTIAALMMIVTRTVTTVIKPTKLVATLSLLGQVDSHFEEVHLSSQTNKL